MISSLTIFLIVSATFVVSNAWELQGPMLFARSDFVAVTVGESVYVMGGCNGDQSALTNACPSITNYFTKYNLATDKWESLNSSPKPRYRYMAATVGDCIYYIGGRDFQDAIITDIDIYNTTSRSWRVVANDLVANISDGAAFVIGSKIYVSGGYTQDYIPVATTIVMDTTVDPLKFSSGLVATKTIAAGDNGAVAIGNYGYVFGGFASDFCNPLASIERYDSTNNTWATLTPMAGGRGDMAYAAVGNSIFIMGGETKDAACNLSIPVATVARYSTSTGQWQSVTPIAISRFRFSGASWPAKYRIYDIGGQNAVPAAGVYTVLDKVYSLNVFNYLNNAHSLGLSLFLMCFALLVAFM